MTCTRSFCCCLPLRFGVFVIAILGLLVGSFIGAVGIVRARSDGGNPIIIIQIIVYILLALISVFGLIGATMRRRRLMTIYWFMLTVHLIFSIVSGALLLKNIFKNAGHSWGNCDETEDDAENTDSKASCLRAMTSVKAAAVAILIGIWLIHIYSCIVIGQYRKQLGEEEGLRLKEETA